MTEEQEQHLQRMKDKFNSMVDIKYKNGAREHGGNIWQKAKVIDMALEEVTDLAVYLLTLKDQLSSGKYYELNKEDEK